MSSSNPCRVLILGVGNYLMGDEGAGIHGVRSLESRPAPDGVRLLDGGTGGVNLLDDIESAEAVILIDATRDGTPAGTVAYRFRRHGSFGSLPSAVSGHEFGLKDLFAAAQLRGALPPVHLFTIAVEHIEPMCTDLSGEVSGAVESVAESAWALAARLAA